MQVIEDDLASFESAGSPGHLAQYEAIYVLETHLTAAATVGLYPIVTFRYSSTTLYQVSYHIQ